MVLRSSVLCLAALMVFNHPAYGQRDIKPALPSPKIADDGTGTGRSFVQSANVKDFGAAGDGLTDDSAAFRAAVAYALANHVGLFVPPSARAYVISSDVTVSSVPVVAIDGLVKIGPGVAFLINGPLVAAQRQIFDVSEPASVVSGNVSAPVFWPEWFGAVGDGSADDHAPIARIISLGAGKVVGFNKLYRSSAGFTIWSDNTYIQGWGRGGIKPLPGAIEDVFSVNGSNVTFDGIVIDCVAGGGSQVVVNAGSLRGRIKNSRLVDQKVHGIFLKPDSGAWWVNNNNIQAYKTGPSGSGIAISSSADHFIVANDIGGFGSAPAIGGSSLGDTSIADNHIYSSRYGIDLYRPRGVSISGGWVQASTRDGIRVIVDAGRYDGVAINGVLTKNNGRSAANVYDGIRVEVTRSGTLRNVTINGVISEDTQTSPTQRYGVYVTGAIHGLSLVGNSLAGNVSGAIGYGASGIDWIVANNAGQSASVASAPTLSPPLGKSVVTITGTTNITSIAALPASAQVVTFVFTDVLTLKSGGNLKMVGDFTTTAGATWSAVSDGTNWIEVNRGVRMR